MLARGWIECHGVLVAVAPAGVASVLGLGVGHGHGVIAGFRVEYDDANTNRYPSVSASAGASSR